MDVLEIEEPQTHYSNLLTNIIESLGSISFALRSRGCNSEKEGFNTCFFASW